MANFAFRGLMAPILTPFKTDLTPDLAAIPDYAYFLAKSGIMGVLVNGTSGEGMSMSVPERKLVTEHWLNAVRTTHQHCMVQIGGAPLPDVLELARHANQVGAHSLLVLPELYFKPKTTVELINYLKLISEAAPKLPILYYHIPSFTSVNIHMGQFLTDIGDQIPNFHGIKFTSNALDEGVEALKAQNHRFAVFLGADQLMAGAYALGFNSAIATTLNIFPEYGLSILNNIELGNISEARKAQDALTELCEVITRDGAWVPAMKAAMNLYSPIKVGPVRAPLINLTNEEVDKMNNKINSMKLMRKKFV